MAMSRFDSSAAMPWKSAGVGAGGVIEIVPQAATTTSATRYAATERWDATSRG